MDRNEDHQEWEDDDGEPLGTPDGYSKDGTPIYDAVDDEPPAPIYWNDRDAGLIVPVVTREFLEPEFQHADFIWRGPGSRPQIVGPDGSAGAETELAKAPWFIRLGFCLVDGRY